MIFDYYYGVEAEQFSFYRVPRLLIKDKRFKGLSSDAKLLYGLMLDRMSLSMKNGWMDEENRVYIIYTVDNIMEDLGCGKDKAIKILAELDTKKGIGLVKRVRRGLGKPDIIYVKNFVVTNENDEHHNQESVDSDIFIEVGENNLQNSEKPISRSFENRLQEVEKAEFKKSEKPTLGGRETRLQEVGKTDPNYTDYNYIDSNYSNQNNTDVCYVNLINPINQSGEPEQKIEIIDTVVESNKYMKLIRNNLEYGHYMKYGQPEDKELFEEIYEIICDIVCVKRKAVRISGEDYPYELVKSRFLKLNSSHVEYVMDCMRETVTKVTNIRSYLITALYNAPATMNHYYQQEVQHDMHSGYG